MEEKDFKRVVKEAMEEMLTSYGFTTSKPTEMQKDMIHLRKSRLGCEATKRNIGKAFITVLIPGMLYFFWETIKQFLGK